MNKESNMFAEHLISFLVIICPVKKMPVQIQSVLIAILLSCLFGI